MRLDEAFTAFLIADDKRDAYQNLLRMLGVPEGAEDAVKAQSVLNDGLLKSPKNWRSFDHLQNVARQQLAKNGEYTLNKIPASSKLFFDMIGIERLRDARVLDLGCGSLDPLLQSIYLVCNGAGHVTAIDPDECPSPERSAHAMANLVAEIALDPEKWCLGAIGPDEVRTRAALFDVAALRRGEMLEGIANAPIRYAVGGVENLCPAADAFDIAMSFSVIEHIMDPVGVLGHVARIVAPGGVLVSQVDFSDHRQFSVPGHNFWTFMTRSGAVQPGINGLRIGELFNIIEATGLTIRESRPYRVPLPDNVRSDLRPRYSTMADEDLETVSTYFFAAKQHESTTLRTDGAEADTNLQSSGHQSLRRFFRWGIFKQA